MKTIANFLKKYYQIILLGAYWTFIVLHYITIKNEENNMFFLIVQLLIYGPITLSICFKKEGLSIFIIIVYELVVVIAGVFGTIMYMNKGTEYLLDTFISLLEVIVGVAIIARCVQLLRNKTKGINLIIVFGLIALIGCRIALLSTVIEAKYANEYLASMVLSIMVSLYIGLFPKKEIKIFV